MPPKDSGAAETALEMARRRVAESEARIARLREILSEIDAGANPDVALSAKQVLATMEATLSILRDHLRLEEQRSGQGANRGN